MNEIQEVKKKKELSGIPDTIVEKALIKNQGDIKDTRAQLRKYFGVFLTNKIIKAKGTPEEILKTHLSSKKREYKTFYKRIAEEIKYKPKTIIDLGCGANGYSIKEIKEAFKNKEYVGIEAAKQVVENTNEYFKKEKLEETCHLTWNDLFEMGEIIRIIEKTKKPHLLFMFQIIDALENIRKDFSKDFLYEMMKHAKKAVITLPTESLGGKKKFAVKRKWIIDFIKEHFEIIADYEMNGERIIIIQKDK